MSELLKNIDARTRLAGTNKLEILLFTLGVDARTGRRETFGINVFKVREVMRTPQITAAPEMPDAVKGMVSLRGALVPVVDLGRYGGISDDSPREIMIVTEYNGHTQGFLVEAVDTILRLDWSQMRVPPEMLTARLGGLVTAVTELADGRLVMLLDVEKVLSETSNYDDDIEFRDIRPFPGAENHVERLGTDQMLDAAELVPAHVVPLGFRGPVVFPVDAPQAEGHALFTRSHDGSVDECQNGISGIDRKILNCIAELVMRNPADDEQAIRSKAVQTACKLIF